LDVGSFVAFENVLTWFTSSLWEAGATLVGAFWGMFNSAQQVSPGDSLRCIMSRAACVPIETLWASPDLRGSSEILAGVCTGSASSQNEPPNHGSEQKGERISQASIGSGSTPRISVGATPC
jgi:hypothetical protein